MTSSYGWIIRKDFVTGLDVGEMGPWDIPPDLSARLLAGGGVKFRLLDGDGQVCYKGRTVFALGLPGGEDDLGPLWDFGLPHAGCTKIQYKLNGKWTTL